MNRNSLQEQGAEKLQQYIFVVHKVISLVSHPYALTKCCLPLLHTRLDQLIKHMTPSVLWRPQKRRPQGHTNDSILDLNQLTL